MQKYSHPYRVTDNQRVNTRFLVVFLGLFSNFYFPMQKCSKMLPKTSSVVTSPTMVPR
jgi:hypothetical protein